MWYPHGMKHLATCLSAILLLGCILASPATAQGLPPEMPVSKADLMVRKAGGLLIDVRTPEEWRQSGVPVTAHTISVEGGSFVSEINTLTGGDKSRRIALICRSGERSGEGRSRLLAAGYQNVTSVAGGVMGPDGWIDADLPVRPWP